MSGADETELAFADVYEGWLAEMRRIEGDKRAADARLEDARERGDS